MKLLKILAVFFAFLGISANSQAACFSSLDGPCGPCIAGEPSARRDGRIACFTCGGVCILVRMATDQVMQNPRLDPSTTRTDGEVAYVEYKEKTRIDQGMPFTDRSHIYAIGQVNPHAAIVVANFLPEFSRETPFIKGEAYFNRIALAGAVHAYLERDVADEKWDQVSRPTAEGQYAKTDWRVEKDSSGRIKNLRIKTYLQDKAGATFGSIYPDIVIDVTPDKPYRLVRWKSEQQ